MKHIGIDARLYFQTGVGVYLRNLLYYLQREDLENVFVSVYCMQQDEDKIVLDHPRIKKKPVVSRWHSFHEQSSFLNILTKDKLDLMHFTYFSYPVLYRRPFISTIHDITPLRYKTGKASTKNKVWYELKYNVFRFVMKSQMKYSRHIITPTKTVKNELIQEYGSQYEKKITFLYEGVNRELAHEKENTRLTKNIGSGYLLYVGNFYPHKNIERLIDAVSQADSSVRLILVGPNDYFTERVRAQIHALNQLHRIQLLHDVKPQDLVYLYRHAKALINPSLSEGFGLPLVEAMYFNLPVLASRIPVFTELLENEYHSFDQMSTQSILSCIRLFFKHPDKHSYDHLLKRYSFERMTKDTFQLYNQYV